MAGRRLAWLCLAPLLVLGACRKADNEPGPGGVTAGEARALDRAAAMIEDEAPPAPAPDATATVAGRKP